jgi:hypothetical protein
MGNMARLLDSSLRDTENKILSMIRSIVLTRSLPHGITQLHSFCSQDVAVDRKRYHFEAQWPVCG